MTPRRPVRYPRMMFHSSIPEDQHERLAEERAAQLRAMGIDPMTMQPFSDVDALPSASVFDRDGRRIGAINEDGIIDIQPDQKH